MLAAATYWLLVLAEGAYFGTAVVCKLYDWTAHRYESIKQFDPYYERWLLGEPIAQALSHLHQPLVLDVATGTCRFPRALFGAGFAEGYVVGLDRSRPMLLEGARLVARGRERLALLQADALQVPFGDSTFDVVACLEALEFFPNLEAGLTEMVRVLKPGGALFITNRKGAARWYMPGHVRTLTQLARYLDSLGMEQISASRWQLDYDLVHARKARQEHRMPGRFARSQTAVPSDQVNRSAAVHSSVSVSGSSHARTKRDP